MEYGKKHTITCLEYWAEFVISVTRTDGSDRLLPSGCYDLLWFSFIHYPHPLPAPLRSLSKGQLWRYAI